MHRRVGAYAVGLLVLALVVVLGWRRAGHEDPPPPPARPPADGAPAGSAAPDRASPRPPSPARAAAREKRDALRAAIVQALASRAASSPPPPSSAAPPPEPRPPGHLQDRIGGREALAASLNRDFMPLADECIEQAQERVPGLAGLVALDFETLADEQAGAVVDDVQPASRNEVADPELLECLRETALSLSLPPPPAGGRERLMLTLRVEARPDAGAR